MALVTLDSERPAERFEEGGMYSPGTQGSCLLAGFLKQWCQRGLQEHKCCDENDFFFFFFLAELKNVNSTKFQEALNNQSLKRVLNSNK